MVGTAYPRVGWLLRQVAVLHTVTTIDRSHYLGLAALDRWLPYTVTAIDRSH